MTIVSTYLKIIEKTISFMAEIDETINHHGSWPIV